MADQKVSISDLTVAQSFTPLRIEYAARFDPSVLRTATKTLTQATSVGGAPVLTEAPTATDRAYAGADGQAWFVPEAVVPPKSKSSKTPAVFIDHEPQRWVLRVTVDLRRHSAVPETASMLPLSELALSLVAPSLGGTPILFGTITELPAPDPSVLRRVEAVAEIDRDRIANALKSDSAAVFQVSANVHYAEPGVAEPEPEPPGPRAEWPTEVVIRDHRTSDAVAGGVRVSSGIERGGIARLRSRRAVQVEPATLVAAHRVDLSDQLVTEAGKVWRFGRRPYRPRPAQPTARTVTVGLTGAAGWPAHYPTDKRVNRPIYALVDSALGIDVGSDWQFSPAGPWRDTGIPGRYYLLPTEYRLAFDVEQQLPAMNVLLVEKPVEAGAPAGSAYRVRVRFAIVPWFDPAAVEALRQTIVDVEGGAFPEFEVGGDRGATFHSTALLQDLGGATVTSDGGLAVDTRGFEYVVEGTLEYYTLITKLLAPVAGAAPGVDGYVRCTLQAAIEEQVAQVRDVPVKLRLDRPATDLLTARLLPVPPVTAWPAEWTPPLYAAVASRSTLPLDVGSVHATLLLVDPDVRLPIDAITATADPAAFALGTPDRPAPAPRPDTPPAAPPYPGPALAEALAEAVGGGGTVRPEVELLQDRLDDLGHGVIVTGLLDPGTTEAVTLAQTTAGLPASGAVDKATWEALFPAAVPAPPPVGAGEVLVELTPTEPVDPRMIGALAASFGGVAVHLEPATVLERVHELAASGAMRAALRVRSYQLQHPDQLPPELAGLFAIEVEIRRPGGASVTVFLSRDEPEKTAQVGFTVGDLLGGATPGAPTYEWRRRNQTSGGTGTFSDWETLAGTELFVTPAA